MKKKNLVACVSVLVVGIMVVLSNAYANYGHGDGFGKGGGLEQVFFMKAHVILENREELGLPDDKAEAIKNLKIEIKKMLIKQNAEIEILGIDIMSKLHDYPVDVNAVNTLVDKKYELKKAKAKDLVEAIAKLKSSLTKDQYDKLRDLWKDHGHKTPRTMG